MRSIISVVAGMAALTVVSSAPNAAPTAQDLLGHEWLNNIRANPTIILPELNYMLCKEFNPTPSPGAAFDTVNNVCNAVAGALWKVLGPILGKGQSAQQFCDSTIRKILSIPPPADPTCKVPNMGDDKIYTRPNGDRILTTEGRAVVEETIAFLKAQKPINRLEWNIDMWKACRDHGEDQAPTGATGHTGSDGSSPLVRMSRYGNVMSPSGENLAWGSSDAKDAIIQLIIDDGVPNRGHRLNIFNPGYWEHGSYFMEAGHQVYDTSYCENFCVTSWVLSEPNYQNFVAAFLQETMDFTAANGAPASHNGYTQTMNAEYQHPRQVKKTVVRTYTLADGSKLPLTKTAFKDLPPKNTA